MNLYAGRGVAVREFTVQIGEADYLLFVDRKAVEWRRSPKGRRYQAWQTKLHGIWWDFRPIFRM
jgi:hypothetical protein